MEQLEKKWRRLYEDELRCKNCMNDAPYEFCCKHHCGERDYCEDCEAECRNDNKLCER